MCQRGEIRAARGKGSHNATRECPICTKKISHGNYRRHLRIHARIYPLKPVIIKASEGPISSVKSSGSENVRSTRQSEENEPLGKRIYPVEEQPRKVSYFVKTVGNVRCHFFGST
jgi:hypothetical protein